MSRVRFPLSRDVYYSTSFSKLNVGRGGRLAWVPIQIHSTSVIYITCEHPFELRHVITLCSCQFELSLKEAYNWKNVKSVILVYIHVHVS